MLLEENASPIDTELFTTSKIPTPYLLSRVKLPYKDKSLQTEILIRTNFPKPEEREEEGRKECTCRIHIRF